jgi:hypothetical protein
MTTAEEFRICSNFPEYAVSNFGNIRNERSGRILLPYSNGHYHCVKLRNTDGFWKNLKVHRLVALEWVENPKVKTCIDHINGNRYDNRASNLRWATHSENNANKPKVHRDTSSRYKGVFHDPARNLWKVYISSNGLRIPLGAYECEHEAGRVYNKYALEEYGEFAHLNIIGSH